MRESWDTYFMKMAIQASTRATCDRLHVGCVLVDKDNRILSTGYNGSPAGLPHCDAAGHLYIDGYLGCQRTNHAEENAILNAAKAGVSVNGARAYVTTLPCRNCAKMLSGANIRDVFFYQTYREVLDPEAFESLGIRLYQVPVEDLWVDAVATKHFRSPSNREDYEARLNSLTSHSLPVWK